MLNSGDCNKFPLGTCTFTPKRPRLEYVMGRSEPGGGKEQELRKTDVIAAKSREECKAGLAAYSVMNEERNKSD